MNELPTSDLSISSDKLRRMAFVAKMKEKADAMGVPFMGGYMDEETGEIYMQTNFDRDLANTMLPDLLDA